MQPYPEWFEVLSRFYLAFSFLCGLLILSDEFIHPQKLASVNLVWPIIALYAGPVALWGYFKAGRRMTKQHGHERIPE